MIACIVYFRCDGHGRWGEILHLLKMEVQFFGYGGKLSHILFPACWMRRYEVGDKLLPQALFGVDLVENSLEFTELLELPVFSCIAALRRKCVRSDFQPAAHMVCDQCPQNIPGWLHQVGVVACHCEVIAHSAPDKRFLDHRHSVHFGRCRAVAGGRCIDSGRRPDADMTGGSISSDVAVSALPWRTCWRRDLPNPIYIT